jgi:Phosphatidylserine decarboxylase
VHTRHAPPHPGAFDARSALFVRRFGGDRASRLAAFFQHDGLLNVAFCHASKMLRVFDDTYLLGQLKAELGLRAKMFSVRRALLSKQDILLRNERQVNILETRNFGRLAFVEVGALSVGRIVQVHPFEAAFRRGEDKSVFKFGGSAVVVFGEAGAWIPPNDLLEHTKQGIETLVRLGETIAVAP